MEFTKTYFGKKFDFKIELPYNERNCGYITVENGYEEEFEYWESYTWDIFTETVDERMKDIEEDIEEYCTTAFMK